MDSIGFIAMVLSIIKFKHEYDNNKCGKYGIKYKNFKY